MSAHVLLILLNEFWKRYEMRVFPNMLSLFRNEFNPFKPFVLFVGHRQTVQTQIRRSKTRSLIWVSIVCLQNILSKFEL